MGQIKNVVSKLKPAAKAGVLDRLERKKVFFSGRFGYGEQEQLEALVQLQGGKVVKDLDKASDYLVLADPTAGKTIQQKALSLNGKGATIQVIGCEDFK